ncbi:MAG: phosphate/phosphite/phosphonate ABC transporter substrate-binding protein [Acidimicrobiales bacterium]
MRLLSYLSPGFPASLFEALGRVVGAEVAFDEHRSGPAPGSDPFADGSADLGWLCATSYVDLIGRSGRETVQLVGVAWVPDDPDAEGRPFYFADLVVRPDSPVVDLSALEGCRIGCNDPISLSGYYALRLALRQRAIDPDRFADLVFTGGHQHSLDMVLAGDLDAAAVDSVVRVARSRADSAVAGLRLVERLGPWPVQPLVASSAMSERDVLTVKQKLLEAVHRPELRRELDNAALATLTETSPEFYDALRRAMANELA